MGKWLGEPPLVQKVVWVRFCHTSEGSADTSFTYRKKTKTKNWDLLCASSAFSGLSDVNTTEEWVKPGVSCYCQTVNKNRSARRCPKDWNQLFYNFFAPRKTDVPWSNGDTVGSHVQGPNWPVAGQGTGHPGAGWGSGSAQGGLSPWCWQYLPPFHTHRWLRRPGGSGWLLVSVGNNNKKQLAKGEILSRVRKVGLDFITDLTDH